MGEAGHAERRASPSARGAEAGAGPQTLALARAASRLTRAAEPPWLHAEAARRMAERLPWIRLQPRRVLDWMAHTGASDALLRQAYPEAEVVAVEADAERAVATAVARPQAGWRRWLPGVRQAPQVLTPDAVPAGSAQLLWANMALHGLGDPDAVFSAWHAALQPGGFLMFSTLGPGTLPELRTLYAAQRWGPAGADFVDMHDLGDALVRAGLADPVMDQETITLTWAEPEAALSELRSLGANLAPRRHPGLRTPRWRERLCAALPRDAQGRVTLRFELVYGHAFRVQRGPRLQAETRIGVDELRAQARAAGPGRRDT